MVVQSRTLMKRCSSNLLEKSIESDLELSSQLLVSFVRQRKEFNHASSFDCVKVG